MLKSQTHISRHLLIRCCKGKSRLARLTAGSRHIEHVVLKTIILNRFVDKNILVIGLLRSLGDVAFGITG
jgi:hypothetical protein